ncbi:MAG: DUF983 domain-containing protein [Saprospiraceae bacterium]
MKGSALYSTVRLKCPRCHEGDLFQTPVFDYKDPLSMGTNCPVCKQKYHLEPGFYWGAMFVSYAISAFLMFGLLALFYFGFNTSLNAAFVWTIALVVVVFVYILRLSRSIWIHLFVKYDKNWQHE